MDGVVAADGSGGSDFVKLQTAAKSGKAPVSKILAAVAALAGIKSVQAGGHRPPNMTSPGGGGAGGGGGGEERLNERSKRQSWLGFPGLKQVLK